MSDDADFFDPEPLRPKVQLDPKGGDAARPNVKEGASQESQGRLDVALDCYER
jgi:hypothetical protein